MAVLLAGLALVIIPVRECFGGGDPVNGWVLHDNEELVLGWAPDAGVQLYDTSKVFLVPGGEIYVISAYDSSSVYMSGGRVNIRLEAHNFSSTYIFGGSVCPFYEGGGGSEWMGIFAYDYSFITFYGKDFQLGGGLTLDPDSEELYGPDYFRVLGTGDLSGKWMNDTPWAIYITENAPTAVILIPEPATIILLTLGGLFLRKSGK